MDSYLIAIIAILALIAILFVFKSIMLIVWVATAYLFIVPLSKLTGIFMFGAQHAAIIISSIILGLILNVTVGSGGVGKNASKAFLTFIIAIIFYSLVK